METTLNERQRMKDVILAMANENTVKGLLGSITSVGGAILTICGYISAIGGAIAVVLGLYIAYRSIQRDKIQRKNDELDTRIKEATLAALDAKK